MRGSGGHGEARKVSPARSLHGSGKRRAAVGRLAVIASALLCVLVAMCGCGTSNPAASDSTVSVSATGPGTPVETSVSTIEPGSSTDGVGTSTSETLGPRLEKIVLVAPAGPMAIPLAYLVANDRLAEVAESTELAIWENADQLKARVAAAQGDFITMPSNNAAIFYNKGLKLKLVNIGVWNITYLVTRDPTADSFTSIKGQSLVVSLKGSVPDVMFQFLATREGLDPLRDFDLRYVSDPPQASQLLLAGEVDNAVLSEALATAVVVQSKDKGRPLRKALAFDQAWKKATSSQEDTPIAGTFVTSVLMERPEVVAVFQREYTQAVEWMLSDPEGAGQLVENELPELGLKAPIMTAALKGITWRCRSAGEVRPYLEQFYTRLAELSPQVIGGKLPDDGFYFLP